MNIKMNMNRESRICHLKNTSNHEIMNELQHPNVHLEVTKSQKYEAVIMSPHKM